MTVHSFWQGLSIDIPESIAWPAGQSVPELFSQQVLAHPDNPALIDAAEQLTYQQLDLRSRSLAARLAERGIGTGDIVALACRRNAAWVTAMLAVMRVGAAWLPLNPADGSERHRYQIADSQPALLLTERAVGVPDTALAVLCIEEALAADEVTIGLPEKIDPSSSAYVMYTSGSTGRPKGVIVSQRNIVRLVKNAGFATLDATTRLLQTGAATFDATTFEIWGPLLNGGCVVLPGDDLHLYSDRLAAAIKRWQITTMWLTSPLFNLHAMQDPATFVGLRELIVGGDVVSAQQVDAVCRATTGLTIINGYGPTENTTFSTTRRISAGDIQRGRIPIGRPFANSTAYVLDEKGEPVARGEEGELYVGGAGVAIGYLNQPELTASQFLPDVFLATGRMYRTGDRAVMQPDGNIDFLGRRDRQVKIRGYRIEPGEIEAALLALAQVQEATVQVRTRPGAGHYLAAYVTTRSYTDDRSLRSALLSKLPDTMLPSFIIILDALPLNSHGKVDRHQLPDPLQVYTGASEYIPPVGELQKSLLALWQQLPGMAGIGAMDSLFDLGVDSLEAARLASSINKRLAMPVSTTEILSHPTVAQLAELLESRRVQPPESAVTEPGDDAAHWPLTPQQYPLYIDQVTWPQGVKYNIPLLIALDELPDVSRLQHAWQTLVSRHHALQLRFPFDDTPQQCLTPEFAELPLRLYHQAPDLRQLIRPFDLEQGPLWRISLHQANGCSWLFVDFHHLIIDGSSLTGLMNQLDAVYNGRETDTSGKQYGQYAAWSASEAGTAHRSRQRAYWQHHFDLPAPRQNLPTDLPMPVVRTYRSAVHHFRVDKERTLQLKTLIASSHTTLFEALALIYARFLAHISGQSKVCFGIPSSAKESLGYAGVPGMFVNTVALALDVNPADNFAASAAKTARQIRDAVSHQDFTLHELTAMLDLPPLAGRHPLFDSLFALQSRAMLQCSLLGQTHQLKPLPPGEVMFDLNLQIYETADELVAEWEYATELFLPPTMAALADMFIRQIEKALAISGGERQQETVARPSGSLGSVEFDF